MKCKNERGREKGDRKEKKKEKEREERKNEKVEEIEKNSIKTHPKMWMKRNGSSEA